MRQPEKWGRTWMGMAHQIAKRSKDASFQAGAVVVASDFRTQLGTGFNGPPSSVDDAGFDWSDRELKRSLVCHAESNALWYAGTSNGRDALKGGWLFVNGRPCSQCAKEIARAGLKAVVWDDTNPSQPKMVDDTEWAKTNVVLSKSSVLLIPYSTFKE